MQATPRIRRKHAPWRKTQCGRGHAGRGSCCCHPGGSGTRTTLAVTDTWGTREEAGRAVWRRQRRLTAKTQGIHDRDLAKEPSLQILDKIHKWSRQNTLMDKV